MILFLVILCGRFIDSIVYMCYCALYLMFVHNLLRGMICDVLMNEELTSFFMLDLFLFVLMIRHLFGLPGCGRIRINYQKEKFYYNDKIAIHLVLY